MKRIFVCFIMLTLALLICACQDGPNPSIGSTPSVQQEVSSKPSESINPTPPGPTLPENCDKGHTFLIGELYCAVCGTDYYSATLHFELSENGKYYSVVTNGNCKQTTIIVPETYNGLPVEEIVTLVTPESPLGPHRDVTHVVLPDSIKVIHDYAFAGYESLVSINIPDGITRIEQGAFQGCQSLVSLKLPESVTYIGDYAFGGCARLKDLQIPEGVTQFGASAFSGCEALEELRIPSEMTEIPQGLAAGCASLRKVTYGKNVTTIGPNAFADCVSLENFVIEDQVIAIGSFAFGGCKALKSIVIPDSVTTIGNAAFQECALLTSIVIPDAVTKIEARTFYKCENLEYVVIGSGVKEFAHAVFDGCEKLKAVYYRGTQAQWEQIKITEGPPFVESTNPKFGDATNYFYSETAPTEEGNFWHYVDGKPTPWKSEE